MFTRVYQIYKDSFSGLSGSVWLLSLIMFINRAGAMVLTFMPLYLTQDLLFTKTEAGWVMGAYGAGSILGAYIGGQLTDRYGYYYIQLYSLIISSLLLVSLIFLEGFYPIIFNIFIFATISDTVRPANSVAIETFSEPENRLRSFSLMRFAINLGFSIGPAVGGIVAQWIGFKWVFLIDAFTCMSAAALLYAYLPNKKPVHKNVSNEATTSNASAYKDREYLIFIILVALWATAFFQIFASAPLFWQSEWHFSESTIGMLLALNGLLIVIMEMPFIKTMEHITRNMKMIGLGSVMLAISFLCFLLGWIHIIPAILFIIFMSFAEMFAMPFMTNYAVAKAPDSKRGQYMALYAMAYGVAHIVAPLGSMTLADTFGFETTYIILLILSSILVVSFFTFNKKIV